MSLHNIIIDGTVGANPIEAGVFFQYVGGEVALCGPGESPDGVTRTGGQPGDKIELVVSGLATVQFATGSVPEGPIASDVNGRAVPVISTENFAGICWKPAKFDQSGGVFAKGQIVLRTRTALVPIT